MTPTPQIHQLIKKDYPEMVSWEVPLDTDDVSEAINEARETTIFQIDDDKLEKEEGYKLPGMKFAVIEGTDGWILTNNEAVHWVGELGKSIQMPVYDKAGSFNYRELPAELSVVDLEKYEIASTAIDSPSAIEWKDWIHYFGIKGRIGNNYGGLVKSMKEIGAISEMPDFWKKDESVSEADREHFGGASPEELQDRGREERERAEAQYTDIYTKIDEIMTQTGFSNIQHPPIDADRWHKALSAVGYKENLYLKLEVTIPEDKPVTRVQARMGIVGANQWQGKNLPLSFKLRSATLAKKIMDDLYPKFAEGEAGWSANYTPKARYRKPCQICNTPVVSRERHLRLPSGQVVCKDCVQKSSRLLDEGVWINEDLEGVHPDKQEWIETGDEELNKIMPELSPEEQRYLMTVASESYEETVAKVQNATGLEVTSASLPSLFSLLMQTLNQTVNIEASNKNYLEELALSLVFSVPEFKIVEDAYMNDHVGFDIALGKAELGRLVDEPEEEEGELTEPEEVNLELADEWQGADETNIKRRFSNLMISGGSINKLYLFNMALEKLERLDPQLPTYYGILSSVAQIGYWITPFGIEQAAAGGDNTAAGSEEVIQEGDKFIIKARGLTFPFLVHEIVKGIYEYLALDPENREVLKKEQVEDETKDMMAGPGVYKTVMSYVPNDKQELMPLIQRKLTDLSADEIRSILAKGSEGQQIMSRLIGEAEKDWATYQQDQEEHRNQ